MDLSETVVPDVSVDREELTKFWKSFAALIHSTDDDDDDDDDDGWKLIKLISSAHCAILEPFHVTFWCLSMNLNGYDLVMEPQPD